MTTHNIYLGGFTWEKGSDIISDRELGIKNEEDLADSLEMLSKYGYADLSLSTPVSYTIKITPSGFESYTKRYDAAKHALFGSVADQIINKKINNSDEIARSLNLPSMIISLILHYYEDTGQLKITEFLNGRIEIDHVSVEFKRAHKKT